MISHPLYVNWMFLEKYTYPFEFSTVEMPYETYNGVNVRLRYVLKVTVTLGYAGSIIEYQDFVVILK
uniref:Arrestin-like N-terminal domain-containing protein n=1 Tax=Salix viminalis TaxID=40686 RepID=A0A6N2KQ76_SALVM